MSEYDLTVVVTAHSETIVAGPAMHSAEIAIRAAEAEGFRIERLIGLDKASDDCRTFFCQPAFADWRTAEVEFGDPYPTRNSMVAMASGHWIAFLDADDLISENWLASAARRLAKAEKDQEKLIVHPELNWIFDASAFVFTKPNQTDPIFSADYFYFTNYYDMMCMAPRAAHLQIPYANRDLANGFGYADMQFAIESLAAGWRHVSIKDTIIFKRRRDQSVVIENNTRRTVIFEVEPLAIDRIRSLDHLSMRA